MNKSELIDAIVGSNIHDIKLSKADTKDILEVVFAEIANALAKGDKVTLTGFGSFVVRDRAARAGRNPKTGETIQIKASKNPAFKAGKNLKDWINK